VFHAELITWIMQVSNKVMPLVYLHIYKSHVCQNTISHIILNWNRIPCRQRAQWTLPIFWKQSSKKHLQSTIEMALNFSTGLLNIIPEGRRRCYHRSTGYQRFHAGAYEYTVGCFCTATACHQGYFLQLMKHLMMLMWLVGIHIHVLKHTYSAESLGKLQNFNPLCLLHEEHPGAVHNFIFSIYPAKHNTKIIT
jgi:hypothetical protein